MASVTSYTPGPWTPQRASSDLIIITGGGLTIAAVGNGLVGEMNANLIAAAPDLVEAILTNNVPAGRAALESRGLA